MKKSILGILTLLLSITCYAQTNQKPYSFKSAYIEYSIEGNTIGKQVVYIDDWGWNRSETTQSVTKMLGQKTETNERKVTIKLDTYQWTPGQKTGSKVHNTMLEEMLADPNFNMLEFSKKTMESLGFKKTGTETVNGKSCDIWKGMGSTIWLWNDIAVKTQVKIFGAKYVMNASKIELNASIPSYEFQIPPDIKFTETSLDQEMIGAPSQENDDSENDQEIKNLKDLKGLLNKLKNE
jgi:predicted transcriptional regulator